MAKKGTKAYRQEYTHIIYGISRKTKQVRSVWLRRDGILSASGPDGTSIEHFIKPGWTAEREAGLVFGLTDTFMVPVALIDGESTNKRLAELGDKASAMADDGSSE